MSTEQDPATKAHGSPDTGLDMSDLDQNDLDQISGGGLNALSDDTKGGAKSCGADGKSCSGKLTI